MSSELSLGIVGSGAMGRGIAQIAALAGIKVFLFDIDPQSVVEADAFVRKMVNRLAEKGKVSNEQAQVALSLICQAGGLEELASCNLVVEAIVEKLEVKQKLFAQLEAIVSEDCILATNTSSLSVTAIAANCKVPSRVAGFHFFNPVPLMKVVEVIQGLLTASEVCDDLAAIALRMGHLPVRAKDTPGFIVNHAGRAYGTEAMAILEEGVAEVAEIDKVLRESVGFRMGPFELYDLTALDVSHPVTEAIYSQFYQDPLYRPSYLLRQRMTAGLLGRKAGRGFYDYTGEVFEPKPSVKPGPLPAVKVWVSRQVPEGYVAVTDLLSELKIEIDMGARPSAESLCIVTPFGEDATTAALSQELDAERTIAIDTLPGLGTHRTLMPTLLTKIDYADAALKIFGADGIAVTMIKDSPGFIAQRVIAMVVNTACSIAQKGIASAGDIDLAVTKGLGYPYGPLAWGDRFGSLKILTILKAMQDFYGDPRYRPSPWLIRRARLGVSLLKTDWVPKVVCNL
jgi:3-hydroxybutyryl-CoA dehydrogenase